MSENESVALPDVDPTEGVEDFDAFWAGLDRKRKTTTIMGHAVTLPASIPLQFELEAKAVQRSKRTRDVKRLVGILFGEDALDRWAAAGMDQEQFMVLLAWAPRVIAGQNVSLAEVATEVRAALDSQGAPDPT